MSRGLLSWWPWTLPSVLSVIIVTTSVPSIITPDGYSYLMGARFMGQPEMADYFPWYRGPLYPAILHVVALGGGRADLWLLVAQALALGVGSTLVAHAFLYGAKRWLIVSVACFVALNPVMLGYAGVVLQQVWFFLALSTYTWVGAWAWRTKPSRSWLPIVACFVLVAFWAELGQQMVYVGFVLGGIVGAAFCRRFVQRDALEPVSSGRGSIVLRLAGVVTLVVMFGALFSTWGSMTQRPWNEFKAKKIAQRGNNAMYLTDFNLSVSGVAHSTMLSDPIGFLEKLPSVTRAILSLGPATYGGHVPQENDIIIGHAFSEDAFVCGVGLPPESGVDIRLGGEWLQQTCRTKVGFTIVGSMQAVGRGLIALSSVFLLVSPVALLLLRKWELLFLLMIPFAFLSLYVATLAGLDRYGMPLYPYGIVAAVAVALSAHGRWRLRSSALGSA